MPVPRIAHSGPRNQKPGPGISGEGSRSAVAPSTSPANPNTDYLEDGNRSCSPGTRQERISPAQLPDCVQRTVTSTGMNVHPCLLTCSLHQELYATLTTTRQMGGRQSFDQLRQESVEFIYRFQSRTHFSCILCLCLQFLLTPAKACSCPQLLANSR